MKPPAVIATLLLLAIIAIWMISTVFIIFPQQGITGVSAIIVTQACLAALFLYSFAYVRKNRFLSWCFIFLGSLFCLIQWLCLVYIWLRDFPFDVRFALDARDEIISTLWNVYGVQLIPAVTAILAALLFFAYALTHTKTQPNKGHWTMYSSVLFIWALVDYQALTEAAFPHLVVPEQNSRKKDKPITTLYPSLGSFTANDDAPVFILQLESGNALALDGKATGEPPGSYRKYMPNFAAAAKEGVMALHMWGASVQTHRAQGAILCGSVADAKRGISYESPPKKCLPEYLKENGYQTVFLSSYWGKNFFNTQEFAYKIGFDDVQIGTVLKRGDTRHRWGFDDCIFYDRAFDYLQKRYTQSMHSRMLAYFVVSSHHMNFQPIEAYAEFWPIKKPAHYHEQYLNSYATQDHCIARFLERVEPFRKNAHVIIMADHSWPVGISGSKSNEIGATSENFLLPFLYLPPKDRKESYRQDVIINSPILGEADILPTLLELLSGNMYPNSFAPLLQKNMPLEWYEDCQVVTQPYNGLHIGVVRGNSKYTYNASKHTLTITHLAEDLLETKPFERNSNVSYEQFFKKYMCDRYSKNIDPDMF